MNEPTTREILDALIDFREAVDRQFVGVEQRLGGRIDGVERRLTNLEARVDDGFTRIDKRLGALERRYR